MARLRVDLVLDRIGRRVAELRRERGWTQEAFAERLGVLPQYLQRIEGGRENLTVESIVRLANELGASLSDMFATPAERGPRRVGRPRSK